MDTGIDTVTDLPEPLPADELPGGRRWYDPFQRPMREYRTLFVILGGILLFAIIFFAPDMFITIHSGEVGVLYRRFAGGTQTDRVLGEGIKIIPPWDKVFIYNVRVQEVKHTMSVLTNEGLPVIVDLSIRYRPETELVGLLHQQVGPDYMEKIVIPEVEASLRTAMGAISMRDAYTSQRALVQQVINDSFEHIALKFIRLDEIVLRGISLPDKVRLQVEAKMADQEVAEAYQFRIQTAREEAERLQIEANGLKTYQNILSTSLNPTILRWEGIQATKALAQSPNAKTIVVGSRSEGLPLILGDGGAAATPAEGR